MLQDKDWVILRVCWTRVFAWLLFVQPNVSSITINSMFQRPCGNGNNYLNIKYGVLYETSSTRSFVECAKMCNELASCLSLNFCKNTTDTICRLFDRSLQSTGYNCPTIASQPDCMFTEKILSSDEEACINEKQANKTPRVEATNYTFKHDESGTVLQGNKDYVLENFGNASYIHVVLQYSDTGGPTTFLLRSRDLVPSGGSEVCTQSIFNYGRDVADSSRNVYRVFYNLCTNGKVHVQGWMIGNHKKVLDSISYKELTWHFRFLPTVLAMTSTESSNIGNLTRMIEKISDGAEMFVLLTTFRKIDSILANGSSIQGQSTWQISVTNILSEFKDDTYWFIRLFTYNKNKGKVMRYYIESADADGRPGTFNINFIEFLLFDQWYLTFQTNEFGDVVYGCKSALISMIRVGHRLRVGVQDVNEEASIISTQDGEVWAQTLDSFAVNGDAFVEGPPFRQIRIVSTLGWLQVWRISIHGGPHILEVNQTNSIKWFVDLSTWYKVYENKQFINGYSAGKLITDGSNVRLSIFDNGFDIFLDASAISMSATTSVMCLGSAKQLNTHSSSTAKYTLYVEIPPAWIFYFSCSNGTNEVVVMSYDEGFLRNQYYLDTEVKWYQMA